MNKITYLFGAGASCNALPIVKEIPERIKSLIRILNSRDLQLDDKSTFEGIDSSSQNSKRVFQLKLIDDLNWLLNESGRHSSVDTMAKKLTIRRKFNDLERLKRVLSVFFIFEQAQKPPDERYDTFYASIIDSSGRLPENIRIISWNYDYQFELAYSEYSGNSNIGKNQERLNVKQKTGVLIGHNQGFGIYKLNGTTEVFASQAYRQFTYIDEISAKIDKDFVETIVKNFAGMTNSKDLKSTLSFAWEPEESPGVGKSFIESVIEDIKDSIALVVVGYSFPFFNREIDRKIVGGMTQLRKVYFQSPEADSLVDRFSAIRVNMSNSDLIRVGDVKQFFLPNEL
jgi:hypothetical protein